MNGNIEESKISAGIQEFERFKALASEAIEKCRKAEEEANYHRGQNAMLVEQRQQTDARHRADLLRIAELEAFVSHVLETYRSAEEKLRLGHFRRAGSAPNGGTPRAAPQPLAIPSDVLTAVEDELRKIRPLVEEKG